MELFQDIRGHEDIKKYFKKAIQTDKISHSYIFEGPKGVGKKMMAMSQRPFYAKERTGLVVNVKHVHW